MQANHVTSGAIFLIMHTNVPLFSGLLDDNVLKNITDSLLGKGEGGGTDRRTGEFSSVPEPECIDLHCCLRVGT